MTSVRSRVTDWLPFFCHWTKPHSTPSITEYLLIASLKILASVISLSTGCSLYFRSEAVRRRRRRAAFISQLYVWCATGQCTRSTAVRHVHFSPVDNVVAAHSLRYRQYADDTQLYLAIRPNNDETFKPVSTCDEDVACWFIENRLLLNPTKTTAVLFGTKVQRDKIMTASGIDVAGQ